MEKGKGRFFAVIAIVSALGFVNTEAATVQQEYQFTLNHSFSSENYSSNSFGNSITRDDNQDTVVSIDAFDTELGTLEAVTLTFTTTVYSYTLSISSSRAEWLADGTPGSVVRRLTVASIDSRVTLPTDATEETSYSIIGVRNMNQDIGGAPVDFTMTLTDSSSLEAFLEGPFYLEILSFDRFSATLFNTALQSGNSTVSASGTYSGTVTVTYQYAVPEPTITTSLLLGLTLLASRYRIRRRSAA